MARKSNRDDFPNGVRNAVALRAAHICSFRGCGLRTVGPSNDSPTAVNMIGVAAHIHAAAPGGPRYLASMTSEERSHIENAIWLCATHARMIDGDEATYTADMLRAMKRGHEAALALSGVVGGDLIAIGPDVVFVGELLRVDSGTWTFSINQFVEGDQHTLVSFIDRFPRITEIDRYALVNAIGDGRILADAPSLSISASGQIVVCPIASGDVRIDAATLPRTFALSEAYDLMLNSEGNIAEVSGLDALPQHIKTNLSLQRNESPWYRDYGTRIAELYKLFRGTRWFDRLLKLELIRLAAIPYYDRVMNRRFTPLQCVERVHGIQVLADSPNGNWLPIWVDFDVKGVGRWQHRMSICIPDYSDNTKNPEPITNA